MIGNMGLRTRHYDVEPLPFSSEARIPKIIHQTYGTAALPIGLEQNVAAIKMQNPGWEHRLYDDADIERYIACQYGARFLTLYQRISPQYGAARADLCRYLLMYRHGGIYLDIKSRFNRPIDDVLKGTEIFVASRWSNHVGGRYEGYGLKSELSHLPRGELQQWHIITVPGHPFLRAVIHTVLRAIETYRPWRDGVGKAGVLRLTGPIQYTLAIEPLLDRHPCTIIADESQIGLDYSIVSGDRHHSLFPAHYTTSETPIVKPTFQWRPVYKAYVAGRSLKKRWFTQAREHYG